MFFLLQELEDRISEMKSFLKALFTSAYIEFVSTGDKKKMNHQRFYHAVRDKMVEKTTQMDVNMEWNHFIMMIFVSAMAFHQLFWLHWYKYTSQTQINNKQLVIFFDGTGVRFETFASATIHLEAVFFALVSYWHYPKQCNFKKFIYTKFLKRRAIHFQVWHSLYPTLHQWEN